MSTDDRYRQAEVRAALMRYLREHRHAADTAVGIAERWLAPEGLQVAGDSIVAILDRMVARGELRSRKLPDGETLYTSGDRSFE